MAVASVHTSASVRKHNPTAPDWLETEDRRLLHSEFAEIEALSGRAFSADAAANDGGDDALCNDYCSPSKSFFDTVSHAGHIWIKAPFCKLLSFVQHQLHCKQLSPSSTSVCILVPGYMLSPLKHLLSGMNNLAA